MSNWWVQGSWNGTQIICQELEPHVVSKGILLGGKTIIETHSSIVLASTAAILFATTTATFLLKPLRMPIFAQILAGVILAALYTKFDSLSNVSLISAPVLYTLRTFSFLGFVLHSFMLGVQTNMSAVTGAGKKKSVIIGFSGFFLSLAFTATSYSLFKKSMNIQFSSAQASSMFLTFNSGTFLMATCSNLNDLRISNSDVGRLASSISMVLDIFGMVTSFLIFNALIPFIDGGNSRWRPFIVLSYYLALFFIFRPLIIYIVNRTPEGSKMSQNDFLLVICAVLMLSFLGEIVDQRFATFLLALTLPEEPLSSVLTERLDSIASGVFFSMYCALRGLQADVFTLNKRSLGSELVLLAGYIGKFLGTIIPSRLIFGHRFSESLALSLIMSSKGLLDLASISIWRTRNMLSVEEFTIILLNVVFLTGGLLPLIRCFYNPLKQYSIVTRRSVIDSRENGTLQALTCIYKEENLPGIVRLLEVCRPTKANPICIFALQLIQLTGRCAMPILAPLHQVTSSSAFRSNLDRCNRIVNAFLHFERETKGYTRLQHYVAVSQYTSMHTDICNLAYEKNASIIILPFHTHWGYDGTIEDSSLTIREVNMMVLEKAPCSVGMLIDRGTGSHKRLSDINVYRIAMLFVGGADDYEAITYSKLFANHPIVRLMIIHLKAASDNDNRSLDCQFMSQFQNKCINSERISFSEVIVKDGAETVNVVVSIKDVVDLVIVGKHHDLNYVPVYGLNQGWSDYPELGILGDILASPDFPFSLLVVQQEPQSHSDTELIEDI